jgi:hypothetical protein
MYDAQILPVTCLGWFHGVVSCTFKGFNVVRSSQSLLDIAHA